MDNETELIDRQECDNKMDRYDIKLDIMRNDVSRLADRVVDCDRTMDKLSSANVMMGVLMGLMFIALAATMIRVWM